MTPPPCEKLLNYSGFVDFFLPHKTSFCAPDTRGLHHTTLVAAPFLFHIQWGNKEVCQADE